jgi:hypothetical protein
MLSEGVKAPAVSDQGSHLYPVGGACNPLPCVAVQGGAGGSRLAPVRRGSRSRAWEKHYRMSTFNPGRVEIEPFVSMAVVIVSMVMVAIWYRWFD